MQKWISPARILGRKNSFCSGVPKSMMVGPTVLMVSMGTGAPARIDSSKKMYCSMAERPWPPYSVGHPMPSQPSVGHLLDHPPHVGTDAVAVGQLGLHLGGEQVGVVLAQPVPERLLFLGVADLHGVPPVVRAVPARSPPGPPLEVTAPDREPGPRASATPDGGRRGRREHVTFTPGRAPPAGRRACHGRPGSLPGWCAGSVRGRPR